MRDKQLGWLPEAEGPGSGSSSGKAQEHPEVNGTNVASQKKSGAHPTTVPSPGQNGGQSHSPTTQTEDLHVTSC